MAAPASAYNTLDMTFLSISHKVAKLTGRHNTLANAKLNFHLDKVIAQRDKSTGALLGFVGVVRANGANAAWRSAARLSRSQFTYKDDGTDYLLLLDAGLNIKGTAGAITVKYAFGNYWHITWPVSGAPYEGCTYRLIMSSTSGGTSQYSSNGSVGQAATVTGSLINRGGMVYWETARTVYLRAEVTNGEGTRTVSTSVRFLAPLNFGPFVPVNSYADTPQRNDPDVVTLLIDSDFEDGIYDAVDSKTAPSIPEAPLIDAGSDLTALLGEGNVSSEASDDLLEAYYNAMQSGGTSYDKPADGYYVNTDGRRIGTQQVFYGIQVVSGRITAIFRARTPETELPTITLVISISEVSTNRYQVSFSLTASTTPSERVTVTISALQLRKTQGGASQAAQFQNTNGTAFNGRTLTIGGSGIPAIVAPAVLITSLATPFWVTATASCDNGSYRFVNNGGQSGTGSGGITPVDPDGPVQVQP